jgi:hypothetical protein
LIKEYVNAIRKLHGLEEELDENDEGYREEDRVN